MRSTPTPNRVSRPSSPLERPSPLRLAVVAALAAGFAAGVAAQTPPDAGSLLRDAERTRTAPVAPVIPALPAPMRAESKGERVTVKAFRIDGATLFPAAELTALLADRIGQTLTLGELEQAARRIAELYREHGWFASVYLPAQDITEGQVVIQVVEGRYNGARIEQDGQRVDSDFVARVATHRLVPGEFLAIGDLERGLMLANDLPGVKAVGVLEPSQQPGHAQLALKLSDGPLGGGNVALDNTGSRSIGQEQVAATVYVNGGDGSQWQLSALAALSGRLASVRAQHARPLGTDGLRGSVYISELGYRLGGDFSNLDASGDATSVGAALAYPLIRSGSANLYLSGSVDHRRYADDMLGATQRRRQANAFTLSLSGDRLDDWGGGGITQATLSLGHGKIDLSGVAAALATDQAGPRVHGRYTKLAGQLSRLQRVTDSVTLSAALALQWAGNNLDSSEQFVLGGPYGVRAYPGGEAAGSSGWLLNLELRKALADGWSTFGFIDGGGIRQYRQTWAGWDGGSGQPNSYRLAGAGVGLTWQRPGDIAVQLTLASPLGDHPGKTAAGKNQDGSARETRAWLRVIKFF